MITIWMAVSLGGGTAFFILKRFLPGRLCKNQTFRYFCGKIKERMKRAALILALGLSLGSSTFAQTFEDYFVDKTLRLDYIFMGNADKQDICLDELSVLPQWAGRRHHLSELPLEGNGEITMKDKATGKIIYRTSFSSLFQEWIGEQEAKVVKRGFENTFWCLIPSSRQKSPSFCGTPHAK